MSESCSGSCGSCSESCSSRKPTKEELLEPMNQYSKVKRVIGVVSGKGGVGKSFITSYLSVLFQRKGYETAILDADVTGPSIPKAFGIHQKAQGNEMGIFPAESRNGTKIMSVNLLLEEEEMPVIWRGPVIAGTVKQFWSDVIWGNVDYMFVDMPPGTGDVPLTVFQSLPLDGIIIVTSPQDLVSMIVGKAVNMAKAMDVPIIGLVENYSYVECDNCNHKIQVFGESKINEVASKYSLELLAEMPLSQTIARAVDKEDVEGLEGSWLDEAVNYIEAACPVIGGEEESSFNQGNAGLRIAVTTDDQDNVFQHFGSCEKFAIYEIQDGKLISKEYVASTGSGHDELSQMMADNKINVLICGGIGQGAMMALFQNGIQVVPGQTGDINVAVSTFLDGGIAVSSESTCQGHSEEGCGCGCGGSCH
ncbi:Chromosome partitioning ATPase, Mrp family, contains Fe-S cluster [[Clostridium] polysaccharolyticum]|uniref:Iron-sulfur cluster carrier protein n=1 Tax=[Clostridium] polysaccharolyticum TaxID=29364 RepID=A0A1I0DTS6_9FIRM|nr:P-loop NTPase [[Clostridium] polysaccharolyticum]SET35872.1 Chromosome partitioning ATPase, Mrp family, contains Fe-S cluster [[Clostridium] polysaccharolyticum]